VIALNSILTETEDFDRVVSIPASYLGGLGTDYPQSLQADGGDISNYASISFPTPWSRVLIEKPVVAQLLKKFSVVYRTHSFLSTEYQRLFPRG
jgi:hypothetical protein